MGLSKATYHFPYIYGPQYIVTCRLEITLVSRVWISPVRLPKPHPSYLVRSTWGFLMPYKSPTASCKTLPHTYPNLLCASRYNIHEFQPIAACPWWEVMQALYICQTLCASSYEFQSDDAQPNTASYPQEKLYEWDIIFCCLSDCGFEVRAQLWVCQRWYDLHFNINAWNFTIISPPIDISAQLFVYICIITAILFVVSAKWWLSISVEHA